MYMSVNFNGIIDLIFPKKCVFCDKIYNYGQEHGYICSECAVNYPLIKGNVCQKCGKPIIANDICLECSNKRLYFNKGRSAYEYDGYVKYFIYKIKFFGKKHYCHFAALEMKKAAEAGGIMPQDLVVPVPMDIIGYLKRGYNQSAVIAEELSKMGMGKYAPVLSKIRKTKSQHKLKYDLRKKNLKNAFKVNDDIKGKSILLIDDVLTTGSTVNECSRMLKKAGAIHIEVLTFAIVNKE